MLDYKSGKILSTISENIKRGKTNNSHKDLDHGRNKIREQDNFIENPFEVVKEVEQCKKWLHND